MTPEEKEKLRWQFAGMIFQGFIIRGSSMREVANNWDKMEAVVGAAKRLKMYCIQWSLRYPQHDALFKALTELGIK